MNPVKLASLGDDSVSREQADRARCQRQGVNVDPKSSGTDHSGSVRLVVDAPQEVSAVTIAHKWRNQLGPYGLADAPFEAYTAAVQTALELAALLHLQTTKQQGLAAPEREPLDRSPDRNIDEHTWLRDTWQTLDDLSADLDAAAPLTTRTDQSSMSNPNALVPYMAGTLL